MKYVKPWIKTASLETTRLLTGKERAYMINSVSTVYGGGGYIKTKVNCLFVTYNLFTNLMKEASKKLLDNMGKSYMKPKCNTIDYDTQVKRLNVVIDPYWRR